MDMGSVFVGHEAALVAAGRAFDRDAVNVGQSGLEVVVDEGAQVLECGGADARHFIKEVVVELLAHLLDFFAKKGEIHHHAGLWVRQARDGDFGVVRVAMDAQASRRINLATQGVGGFEVEALAEFKFHRIPIILWVCRLNRQRGCAWQ